MARVLVKSTINKQSIERKFRKDSKKTKQLAEITLREIEDYVPYRTGRTTRSGRAHPGYVTYTTPYVQYIYKGKHMRFNRAYHSRATWDWIRKGYTERQPQIAKRAQKEIFHR